MRNQQWNALCAAWNQVDAALVHYKPLMFTGVYPHELHRDYWLESVATAARQSLGWFRLGEEPRKIIANRI
jgi:hypothetical protein